MNTRLGRIELRGIVKKFGSFVALKGINLDIEPVEFFALLGPSGSGKTTMLRIIAGLETPDAGTLHVDGKDITDTAPGERDVAMVFQAYALYPHMTVGENIGFPLKMDKKPKDEIKILVQESAARLKIDDLLHRLPGQLSGGQQQRCALARAIVRKPRLFLLDEPLFNLDARLRLQTRVELKQLHRNLDVTTVYVTHDQEEAMTLADRIAVFFDGEIIQVGSPDDVFNRPRNVDVAAFIGSPPMNLIPATMDGRTLHVCGGTVDLPRDVARAAGPVTMGIRPSNIRLDPDGLPARLYLLENLGESMLLNLHIGDELLKAKIGKVETFDENQEIRISFDPAFIQLFDPETGLRLEWA